MALRKASSYSRKYTRPYTRKSKKKSKNYIKTVPQQKIVKFIMGNLQDYRQKKLKFVLKLIVAENVLVRDTALEAMRQYVHKQLDEEYPGQYYLEVRVFPHHILRENRVLTGAGADRMQTGMQQSFGTTIGRAAIVKSGHEILVVAVPTEKARAFAVKIISRIKSKIPGHTRLQIEQIA